MSASEAAPPSPDPVRLAFARIELWKAACLTIALLALAAPWFYFDWGQLGGSPTSLGSGWQVLGQHSSFRAVLPWIVIKVLAVHLLLAIWSRRRPSARLPAALTLVWWAASTGVDAFLLWATGGAVLSHSSYWGGPLAWNGIFEAYNFESNLNPGKLLFVEGWLGVATLAFAVGPYALYRGLQARAWAEVTLGKDTPAMPRAQGRAVRMALLVGALVLFLALPWSSTRHFRRWRYDLPVPDRAPGFVFLFGDEGQGQRDGASLMTIAHVALLGLAWLVRPRVLPRGRPARLAVLGAEAACLLAWGVGYALLAFPPIEWLGSWRWNWVSEVAPFLNAQLLALCLLESLWFCVRRRSTDSHRCTQIRSV